MKKPIEHRIVDNSYGGGLLIAVAVAFFLFNYGLWKSMLWLNLVCLAVMTTGVILLIFGIWLKSKESRKKKLPANFDSEEDAPD